MTCPSRTRSIEVREAAAEQQSQGHREDRMTTSRPGEEDEHPGDGDAGEDDHAQGCSREQPERDPGVLDMVDRERSSDVGRLAQSQGRRDDCLGRLVGRNRGPGDRRQPEPLPEPGPKRTPGAPLRDDAVGRRPDPDLRGGPGPFPYRSSFRLQSMHKVAQGIASSRSGGIWAPQLTQVPYVPASIRASAASMAASRRPSLASRV